MIVSQMYSSQIICRDLDGDSAVPNYGFYFMQVIGSIGIWRSRFQQIYSDLQGLANEFLDLGGYSRFTVTEYSGHWQVA